MAWTVTYWVTGLLTPFAVKTALYALPGTLLGLWLGDRLARRLSGPSFVRVVGVLLVIPALKLLGVL